jgi:hypothetical protein
MGATLSEPGSCELGSDDWVQPVSTSKADVAPGGVKNLGDVRQSPSGRPPMGLNREMPARMA